MKYSNLAHIFFDKGQEIPLREAYRFKKDGKWYSVRYDKATTQGAAIAAGLASMGIKSGDCISIMSNNRMEWALIDYAVMALGAVLVPIYPTLALAQVRYILNDAHVKMLIVENQTLLDFVKEICRELPNLHYLLIIDKVETIPEPWLTYDTVINSGLNFLSHHPEFAKEQIEKVQLEDTATVIYTSGTTGEPKGVILTHKNILSNIESISLLFEFYPEDILLSFLPLSHVFERTIGHYLSCYHGIPVAYAENLDTIPQNILEIRPTLLIAVPRLFEKMHSRVLEQVEQASTIKRKLFYMALNTGSRVMQKKMKQESVPLILKVFYSLFHIVVFRKLKARFGGRLRFMVSGGAPLPSEIAEFFDAAGLRVLEGYGITETSPAVTINRLDSFKYGSVGQPLPGVEVQIAGDGEILVKGDLVMRGYFNKKEETDQVIDSDGWFYTGDIGFLDGDGFLTITDRKKNIIVTSGGKNIAPVPIEHALLKSHYIDQLIIIGDKRNYCTALIVPGRQPFLNYAQEHHIHSRSFAELLGHEKIRDLIRSEIDHFTAFLSRYETIKDFCLIAEPFTQENGQLTPTLKVRRNVVEKIYSKEIEAMYS
jgi:long-chain acyl-CoA synthetase